MDYYQYVWYIDILKIKASKTYKNNSNTLKKDYYGLYWKI